MEVCSNRPSICRREDDDEASKLGVVVCDGVNFVVLQLWRGDITDLHMAGNIKDKEAFQRMNFLYQAAHCVLAQNPENIELARFYCHTQKTISKRLVLRQDPSVKRTICKKCSSLLIPGVTSTVRQKLGSRRQRRTIVRCLSCGLTKRFPNNPKHQLWVDQPEAQLENQTAPEASKSKETQGKQSASVSASATEKTSSAT